METAEFERLLGAAGGIWQRGHYREVDLHGKVLVVAATPDGQVNRQVHDDARALNLPVNVVDSPDLCTFIFPAIVERGPLTVAISSGGNSPVLVRDEAMYGTDKLPKFAEDSFRTTDDRWLIPTSEVSLTASVMGELLDESALGLHPQVAVGADRFDRVVIEVAEPQPAVMPTRALAKVGIGRGLQRALGVSGWAGG